jgi:hypothetical protein
MLGFEDETCGETWTPFYEFYNLARKIDINHMTQTNKLKY